MTGARWVKMLKKKKSIERGKRNNKLCFNCKKRRCPLLSLLRSLKKRGVSHTRGYYHYTRLSDFIKIIKSRRFCLSRVDKMNDAGEVASLRDRTYVLSLSIGDEENVGMWSTYGVPRNDAIRIRFPYNAFDSFVDRKNCGQSVRFFDEDGMLLTVPSYKVRLQDVCYVNDGATRFVFGNKEKIVKKDECPLEGLDRKTILSSFWKKFGWRYEHETRLVVEFHEPLVDKPDKIGIDFSEPLISLFSWPGMTSSITAGPWMSKFNVTEALKSCRSDDELINKKIHVAVSRETFVKESMYKDQLYFRCDKGNCDKCKEGGLK